MASVKKNTFFNFLLTFSSILFPLVSMPYISRVLNIQDIGMVNKGMAFCSFFCNIFSFGLAVYGARQIARVRDNEKLLNETFSTVFVAHILATILGLFFYYFYILIFLQDDVTCKIYFIFSFLFAVQPFSIDWLYAGLEEFKYISLRSILVKLFMLLSLFIFVKNKTDFYIYAVLYVCAQGLNAGFNMVNARKFVKLTLKSLPVFKVIWDAKFFYFQPLVAVCYQNINQLILGSNAEELALFVRASTLSSIIGTCIGPIMSAVKPRIDNGITADNDGYKKYIDFSFDFVSLIIWPLGFGIAAVSENVMYLFGGESFSIGYPVLMILGIGNIFIQYNVYYNNIISTPAGKERNTFWSCLITAIVSLLLNPFMITRYRAVGAALVLVFSEFIGTCTQLILINKQKLYTGSFSIEKVIYIASAICMFVIVRLSKSILNFNIYIETAVTIIIGIIAYTCLVLLLSILFKKKILLLNLIFKNGNTKK